MLWHHCTFPLTFIYLAHVTQLETKTVALTYLKRPFETDREKFEFFKQNSCSPKQQDDPI